MKRLFVLFVLLSFTFVTNCNDLSINPDAEIETETETDANNGHDNNSPCERGFRFPKTMEDVLLNPTLMSWFDGDREWLISQTGTRFSFEDAQGGSVYSAVPTSGTFPRIAWGHEITAEFSVMDTGKLFQYKFIIKADDLTCVWQGLYNRSRGFLEMVISDVADLNTKTLGDSFHFWTFTPFVNNTICHDRTEASWWNCEEEVLIDQFHPDKHGDYIGLKVCSYKGNTIVELTNPQSFYLE